MYIYIYLLVEYQHFGLLAHLSEPLGLLQVGKHTTGRANNDIYPTIFYYSLLITTHVCPTDHCDDVEAVVGAEDDGLVRYLRCKLCRQDKGVSIYMQ